MGIIKSFNNKIKHLQAYSHAREIFSTFQEFTMIPKGIYVENLLLSSKALPIEGSVVECGVWRGGMISGMAKILGNNRDYYLYDSFEGLPDADDLDGQKAIDYQKNTDAKGYFDNCTAEIGFAQEAVKKAGISKSHLVKGWFDKTVPNHPEDDQIAILRLDGDWYKSIKICLDHLFDKVVDGGLIILDDYYVWDGCTKAVHDFLSERKLSVRIKQFNNLICYIEKKSD